MEFQKQLHLIKEELMKYAMCSNINEIKKVFYQNNNNFGKNKEWLLLSDIFKYACETMNFELLEILYEIYEDIDSLICQDNNPEIFYKSILFDNTSFYTKLLSYQGPSVVFNKNKQNLIDFTIKKRCRFMLIRLCIIFKLLQKMLLFHMMKI